MSSTPSMLDLAVQWRLLETKREAVHAMEAAAKSSIEDAARQLADDKATVARERAELRHCHQALEDRRRSALADIEASGQALAAEKLAFTEYKATVMADMRRYAAQLESLRGQLDARSNALQEQEAEAARSEPPRRPSRHPPPAAHPPEPPRIVVKAAPKAPMVKRIQLRSAPATPTARPQPRLLEAQPPPTPPPVDAVGVAEPGLEYPSDSDDTVDLPPEVVTPSKEGWRQSAKRFLSKARHALLKPRVETNLADQTWFPAWEAAWEAATPWELVTGNVNAKCVATLPPVTPRRRASAPMAMSPPSPRRSSSDSPLALGRDARHWGSSVPRLPMPQSPSSTAGGATDPETNMQVLKQLIKSCVWRGVPEVDHGALCDPRRSLVRHGFVDKLCRKSVATKYLWLLSDMLLYGTRAHDSAQCYLSRCILLKACRLSGDVSAHVPRKRASCAFTLFSPSKSFVLLAPNPKERDLWMADIERCIVSLQPFGGSKAPVELAPVWMPDSASPHCGVCASTFSLLKRRHHCRACGDLVCRSCSENRQVLAHISTTPVRVCDVCVANAPRRK